MGLATQSFRNIGLNSDGFMTKTKHTKLKKVAQNLWGILYTPLRRGVKNGFLRFFFSELDWEKSDFDTDFGN